MTMCLILIKGQCCKPADVSITDMIDDVIKI